MTTELQRLENEINDTIYESWDLDNWDEEVTEEDDTEAWHLANYWNLVYNFLRETGNEPDEKQIELLHKVSDLDYDTKVKIEYVLSNS